MNEFCGDEFWVSSRLFLLQTGQCDSNKVILYNMIIIHDKKNNYVKSKNFAANMNEIISFKWVKILKTIANFTEFKV